MGIPSLGSGSLDPFAPVSGPASGESPELRDEPTREQAPLPEGSGTVVDTSA